MRQRIFWDVWRSDQGQAVTRYRPQVAGAAEGVEGEAEGLTLSVDRSVGDWSLYLNGIEIAGGTGPLPEMDLAINIAKGNLLGDDDRSGKAGAA